MSTWRKAMTYLGLGPEEEYDEYASGPDDRGPSPELPPRPQPPARSTGTVRPRPQAGGYATPPDSSGDVRPLPPPPRAAQPVPDESTGVRVRPVPRRQRQEPIVIVPTTFNQAQELGDAFKNGRAVAMDIADVDRDLARRLIDFSAGLCYGLGGNMKRISSSVYLVVPDSAEVTADELARLARRHEED